MSDVTSELMGFVLCLNQKIPDTSFWSTNEILIITHTKDKDNQ